MQGWFLVRSDSCISTARPRAPRFRAYDRDGLGPSRRRTALTVLVLALALGRAPATADETRVRVGAEIYSRNCSPCHGPRLIGDESAFDLRKFPSEERERFVNSVTNGKNSMPPWGDLLKPADIDALWAYVLTRGR
jgi:mono/diheme cytochrome c family protein